MKTNNVDQDAIEQIVDITFFKGNLKTIGPLKPMKGIKRFYYPIPLEDDRFQEDELSWLSTERHSLKDLSAPLNINMLRSTDGRPQLISVMEVQPKDVRGKVNRFYPGNISVAQCWLSGAKATLAEAIVSYNSLNQLLIFNDSRFRSDWESRDKDRSYFERQMKMMVAVGSQIQFIREMQWIVQVREPHCLGCSFPTSHEGAREIFKLRDVPAGKKRRSMIKNWVREHYRQQSSGDKTHVMKHFRGVEYFTWNDMEVTIIPSLEDMKEYERAYEEKYGPVKSHA